MRTCLSGGRAADEQRSQFVRRPVEKPKRRSDVRLSIKTLLIPSVEGWLDKKGLLDD